MKCLILAAGYATRLYPLTENFPKPLLKVQDKPILDWLIDDIDTLGAVKDIQFTIEKLQLDDDMLVIAGDNLLDFSLTAFIAYAQRKQASCIMRYYEPSEQKLLKCGVVTVDEDDRITEMTEKSPTPATHWCCPPFYFYTREDAKLVEAGIAAGCGTDAPGSYIAWLCKQTAVYAMEMPGSRYDIGNLESYETVQKTYTGIR